ncbi:hypothetical protein BCEN4_1560014 [Burkholderia cenocepacia]|nr:hypothetical protein BCEN4_1560014 [Burkholderia cenocepacia]
MQVAERSCGRRQGRAPSVTIGASRRTDAQTGRQADAGSRVAKGGAGAPLIAYPAPDFTGPSREKCRAETSVDIFQTGPTMLSNP